MVEVARKRGIVLSEVEKCILKATYWSASSKRINENDKT